MLAHQFHNEINIDHYELYLSILQLVDQLTN